MDRRWDRFELLLPWGGLSFFSRSCFVHRTWPNCVVNHISAAVREGVRAAEADFKQRQVEAMRALQARHEQELRRLQKKLSAELKLDKTEAELQVRKDAVAQKKQALI